MSLDGLVDAHVLADDSMKHVRLEPVQVCVERGRTAFELVLTPVEAAA